MKRHVAFQCVCGVNFFTLNLCFHCCHWRWLCPDPWWALLFCREELFPTNPWRRSRRCVSLGRTWWDSDWWMVAPLLGGAHLVGSAGGERRARCRPERWSGWRAPLPHGSSDCFTIASLLCYSWTRALFPRPRLIGRRLCQAILGNKSFHRDRICRPSVPGSWWIMEGRVFTVHRSSCTFRGEGVKFLHWGGGPGKPNMPHMFVTMQWHGISTKGKEKSCAPLLVNCTLAN